LKISVIIPTRHRNDLLAQCLARLAPERQTLAADSYEVIVTDDGSQSTAQDFLAQNFPWVRWVCGPRKGPAANRNNGARHAAGDWIAFTDDDCLPDPEWLAAFEAAIQPDVLVYEGKTTCLAGISGPLYEAPLNLTGGCLWSCNMMLDRRTFERFGGFDEAFPTAWAEDVEFSTRLSRAGLKMQFVPEAAVDHPPRRRQSGWKQGLRWESRLLLHYKIGNKDSAWSWLPIHFLKVRISQLLEYPLGWQTIRAGAATASEFACVLLHLGTWDRRYRGQCDNRPGAAL
jgi:GT2 family glycosyltransferase